MCVRVSVFIWQVCECPLGPEESIGSAGAGVAGGSGCWELNSGTLEDQQLLTVEPSLQTAEMYDLI